MDAPLPWWRTRSARALAIAGVAVGLYAAVGFLALPWWARGALERRLSELTARAVTIEQVRVNPFALSATVEGLALRDERPSPLFELGRLHVDFELSSMFRGAWVFREIAVERPVVRVTRARDGTIDWVHLAADVGRAADSGEVDAAKRSSDPAAVWIQDLALEGGEVALRDETTEPPFSSELAPLSFSVRNFGTQAGETGEHAFTAESEAGERLTWAGRLSLEPLVATGSVALHGLRLPKYGPYLSRWTPLRLSSGTAAGSLRYRVALEGAGPKIEIRDVEIDLESVATRLGDAAEDFARVGALRVRGASARYPALEARVPSVTLDGGRLVARIGVDGRTSLDALLGDARARTATTASTPGDAQGDAAWRAELGELEVRRFDVDAEHATPTGDVPLRVRLDRGVVRSLRWPLSATATSAVDLDLAVNDGGRVRVRSQIGFEPLRARGAVTIDALELAPFEPYVGAAARLSVPSGALSLTGTVTAAIDERPTGSFEGRVQLDGLRTIDVTARRDFVRWRALVVDGARFELEPPSLAVSEIRLLEPYARVLLRADGSSNVTDIFASPDHTPASTPRSTSNDPPLAFRVDVIRVRDGVADFADRSVTPRFEARIERLGGRIERLSSTAVGSGRVQFEGRVDRYAPVVIGGELHPFSSARPSRLSLDFRNLEMTTLTPYAARFAGHTIEQGKLNVGLEYTLRGRVIEGQNQVVIDRLVLGDRVDSPDAVKLPVKLAVALLKNKDGVIEVDLPVSGSLDDPEFRVGKVVWKAVLNLMEKAVLSPFAALGGALGARDETARVPFLAGTSTTTPEVSRDVAELEAALADRPELVLEIEGRWSPDDRRALADVRLDALLAALARREDVPSRGLDDGEPAADVLVREAHRRAFAQPSEGAAPAATSTSSAPLEPRVLRPWTGPEPAADAPPPWRAAPVAELRAQLLEAVSIERGALRELAMRRAEAVRHAVAGRGRVAPTRVFVLEPSAGDFAGALLRLDAP